MPIKLLFRRLITVAILCQLSACADNNNNNAAPILSESVSLQSGAITGQVSSRAASWEWLGIPYAQAPVGELRWRAPVPEDAREQTLDASAFAPMCPQFDFFGAYVGDEDCLYLNVWRPQNQQRDLPVFFWIHGGGNTSGSTSEAMYDGARLAAAANIVVVTIQYRLGPLGWLYYGPLQDGDANDNSGNFGTLDIIAALAWVQDNINDFGGNPDDVTAAGESAGGANVLSLMLSEQTSGMFHKAIVQSAGGRITPTATAANAASELVDELMALEGLTSKPFTNTEMATYLRGKSAEALIRARAEGGIQTGAIYGDDTVIPAAGYQLFDNGDFPNKVPLLIGTNQDEYKLYTNPIGYNVLPLASDELRDAVGRYASDLWRVNGADSIATRLRALDDYPAIYVYRFNWGSPDEDGNSPLPGNFGATGGAHHAAELPFMFGNPDSFILNDFKDLLYDEANKASRETIAQVMTTYWGNFIRQSDPNGDNQPSWSPWSNSDGDFRAIVLDVNYADKLPKITEDYTVWTTQRVLDLIDAKVAEPLRSELLPYLESRIDPE